MIGDWGENPGGWAVRDLATEVDKRLATRHIDPYWTRKPVEKFWSDQSAVHVKP